MERQTQVHPFAPVWDKNCRVLVLGTFPSVKSRENAFYYGHPQNRFWRVLGGVYREAVPADAEGKRAFLLRHHIALWDVIASCSIAGSADAGIREETPSDLRPLIGEGGIGRIFLNGKTAQRLYLKYWKTLELPAVCLPSTSPANAAWTLERLTEAWSRAIKEVRP